VQDSTESAAALLETMKRHVGRHDRAALVREALGAVERGDVDIPTLYSEVLAPLLGDVGERWHEGELRVWEEHEATASVVTAIEALYPTVGSLAAHGPLCGQVVVLATPSQEHHVIGLRMVSDLFELAGWTVVYLGADTPEPEIRDAVLTLPADAVVMSAATAYQRVLLRHIADRLHEELPRLRVWVGGHAFADEHEGWPEEEILDLLAIRHTATRVCHDSAPDRDDA
jgi:MerR family transcriptional regulator, light-induced transcriptional regulator